MTPARCERIVRSTCDPWGPLSVFQQAQTRREGSCLKSWCVLKAEKPPTVRRGIPLLPFRLAWTGTRRDAVKVPGGRRHGTGRLSPNSASRCSILLVIVILSPCCSFLSRSIGHLHLQSTPSVSRNCSDLT